MKAFRRFITRLIAPITRNRNEERLREEIAEHLALQTAENIRAGLSPDEARRQAVLKFGAVEALKEDYRDQERLPILEHFLHDTRYAMRSLRKNPGFTAVAVLTLALGLCANVAIFAFVDAALIQPLPYREPSRLVTAFPVRPDREPDQPRGWVSYLNFLDWKVQNDAFSAIAAYDVRSGATLTTPAGMERVSALRVTSGFFETLGVRPSLGREFRNDEEGPAAPATVVLTHRMWETRFGARADVLGQMLILQGQPHVVIGVLPPDFAFPMADRADFWLTIRGSQSCWQSRGCRSLETIGRLADGLSVQTAAARLERLVQQQDTKSAVSPETAKVVRLTDVIFRDVRPAMLMLLSGAGLLLLIAGINVVSLILARSDRRMKEIAIRNALGASHARLASQFAAEACVVVMMSGTIGLMLATWGMSFLSGLLSVDMLSRMPYLSDVRINARVAGYAATLFCIAAMVFTLLPFIRVSASRGVNALREGTRGSSGSTWRRFGGSLVVVELAFAVILLVSAGLIGKSLFRLLHVNLGFNAEHLITLSVSPTGVARTDEPPGLVARLVADRISALPGVRTVGYADLLPLGRGLAPTSGFQVVGRPADGLVEDHPVRRISAGYFLALQAKLLRGRFFTEEEVVSTRRVVIINETAAQRYFPGENPIGRQIVIGAPPSREVVGVVFDIKDGPPESPSYPAAYVPFDQANFGIVVRASEAEQSLMSAVTGAIREVRPDLLIQDGRTMTELLNRSPSTTQQQASAWVVGGFAGTALLLSLIGLYGVIAYSVAQRTREIGIRMALGAYKNSICRVIVGEAALLIVVGTALGTAGAVAVANLTRGLLFGVQPWDAPTLSIAASVLIVAALLASYLPARRAARVDPLVALRYE